MGRWFNRKRREIARRPIGLWGPQVPADFRDNGCGVLGTRLLDFGGLFSWPARIHDFAYSQIAQMTDKHDRDLSRYQADWHLKANLRKVCEGRRWPVRVLGAVAAWTYFYAVRKGGWTVTHF